MNKTNKILLSFFLILMTGLGFSQSVPSYVPTNGLVGWWGFNGNAQDGSGNGNHGTVNGGGVTQTLDRFSNTNSAYFFDGSDSWISIPYSGSLYFDNFYTVSVWFNKIGSTNSYAGDLITKERDVSPGSITVRVMNTIPNIIGISAYNVGGAQSTSSIVNGQWYHMVGTFDNGVVKIYVNGVLEHTTANPNNQIGYNTNPFWIGKQKGTGWPGFFYLWNGSIDDIGMWNRALTQQEITNLYNSQLPTQTSLCLPTITTSSPTSVGIDSVVIGGNITNDGGSAIVLRGFCYSTSPNPNMGNQRTEDGSGTGSFNTVLRGLSSSTTYYARSYAKNSNGVVAYGNEVSFTTSASLPGVRCPGTPTVTDIDGNVYYTVQIGNQCWTQSNLKTSNYRNGDNIPTGLSNSAWQNTTSGAYAIYDNDAVNNGLYGKLYNHYAVTDSRGLCPTGWHVPSDAEWTILENHLGWSSVVGGALKSTAMQPTPGGWASPNTGATNSSGFTAPPGGLRYYNGDFYDMSGYGYWWSSSVSSASSAWGRCLYYSGSSFVHFNSSGRTGGFSVRCLKD